MKTSANKELVHYYGQGLPYIYRIDFTGSDKNLSLQSVEIGGIAYVLGTDIHPSEDDSKRDVIFLLAEAINGNAHRKITSKKDNPYVFAKYEGDSILLVGRESGVDFTVVYAGFTVAPTTTSVVAGSGGAIGSLIGALTDAPIPDGTQASSTAASMITLLKSIVNNTADIEVTLENNGTIEVAVDELEGLIGALSGPKVTNPDAASASLNSLMRGLLQVTLNNVGVDGASDLVEVVTYLDAADPVNRRVSTIVRSSVALALSYTDTFTYSGSAGDYYLTGRTRT